MSNSWFVYLVKCNDDTLYAGITTDLSRRIEEHNNSPKGAKYTRVRRPVSLAYAEAAECRSTASKREYQLRKMTRAAKLQLIAQYQASSQ